MRCVKMVGDGRAKILVDIINNILFMLFEIIIKINLYINNKELNIGVKNI